ncbi:hypothetical protein JCM5350_004288 [Sporobolomyces pararoseus]
MNGIHKQTTASLATTQSSNQNQTNPTSSSTDLWSSILDSVKGTRGTAGNSSSTKQCIVLGSPRSGKSTLVKRISSITGELSPTHDQDGETLDLGMSYSVLDVKDESPASTAGTASGEEDTLARLSIYQLPSAQPPFPALLPLALKKETLSESVVVIVLDWEKPWDWIRELKEWIRMLKEMLLNIDEDGKTLHEAKEQVENYLRNYREPVSTSQGGATAPTTITTSSILDNESALPDGTLLENLGVPIVVVCTKADHINTLERSKEFTEEQFDYIQQTLRTICLRYGAALCFTNQTLPQSFQKLRQYILHRLFSNSTVSSSVDSNSSNVQATTTARTNSRTTRGSFPFNYRANVLDRDQIFVPTGWDSWGKIKILREKFDCHEIGDSWETSLSAAGGEEEGEVVGLEKDYGMIIVDFDAQDQPNKQSTSSATNSITAPQPEQSFLQLHYQSLQADLEKDPRLAFRHQPSQSSSSSSASTTGTNRNGVVGPMSGLISDLPNVQGALDRASSAGSATGTTRSGGERDRDRVGGSTSSSRAALGTGMSRQVRIFSPFSLGVGRKRLKILPSSRETQNSASSHLPSSRSAGSSSIPPLPQSSSATPSSTTTTSGTAAGGNQVLADFFQSLLTARSGGSGTTPGVSGNATPSTISGALRRPSAPTEQAETGGTTK